jgi:hypothetical protein
MKNIHTLPTDKPSRLYNCFSNLEIGEFVSTRDGLLVTNQNIYITSDEEIKEGDWVIQVNFEKTNTQIIHCITEFQAKIANDKNGSFTKSKIILTTDPELIKDGVQTIDDEFLEWFVKNPSCEMVEVEKENYKEDEWVDDDFGGEIYVFEYERYKIIIQKEEHKQETLEEVAKKQWGNVHRTGVLGFIEGAKWQQEQDKNKYSEEDMKKCWDACLDFNKPAGFDNGIPFNEFLNNLKRNKL